MALPESQGGIDYPDGGFSAGQGGFPMVGNLGELAARLGALSVYDRQGTVIWQTDFEHGLQGSVIVVDDEGSIGQLVSSRANHGCFSLELDPRNADGSEVSWRRILQFLEVGKIGVEISLSVDDDFKNVRLTMWSYDGDYELYAPLDYEEVGGLWKIRDRDEGWVTVLGDFVLQQGPGAWHNIKFTIDTEEETYGHLLVGRHIIDISSYNLKKTEADDLGQLAVRFTNNGELGRHAAVYLDSVIITQNES